MDDDENDNEDDDDDDVYDDVVLKVPSSRIRFATTSRNYSWRQVAPTEGQEALQKRSAFTQKALSVALRCQSLVPLPPPLCF